MNHVRLPSRPSTALRLATILVAAWPLAAVADVVQISSLKELADYAGRSGNVVVMKPGVYRLTDVVSIAEARRRHDRNEFQLLTFSGDRNEFRLDGVVIEEDTVIRKALAPPIHTNEFVISGSHNTLSGLTIVDLGDGISNGGAAVSVDGADNTLRSWTITVRGSFPYGYGDLFGKGGPNIINPLKKSGVHVVGDRTRLIDCKVFMRSFGHGIYVQGGSDHQFEGCYVEGVMRPTAEMLAETSGPAFKAEFRTLAKNRRGEARVTPGYIKSLSEDGFRMYEQAAGEITIRNCTARNMRHGFELRPERGVRVENCTAVGCEVAFWVGGRTVVKGCRGDAQYGPLLLIEGDDAKVDLELSAVESDMNVHALAAIQGARHEVTIRPASGPPRKRPVPILLGFGTPMMGEGMAPIPPRPARDVLLRNETTMPVVVGLDARDCRISSKGPVEHEAKGVAPADRAR
ncbi:right-handed parallel beta-helix repeat-containing protein [Paludisphaera rhizosphaerae]|nr:right-handed parallel beta-helix repeat-containing protein [Paludisphaera rhizosphaerae]